MHESARAMSAPEPLFAHALLVEQHAFLRRLARSLVADPERADDLAQDVAVLALRHPPRAGSSPRAWLARVLRNRAVSVARSETRRRDREAHVPEPAPQPTPPELEARLRAQRAVIEAVTRLEEPYRSVVLLRYDQDLAPTAIAEHLGVPVATVKTRLARALERLRRDLDARDEPGTPIWSVVLLAGPIDLRPMAVSAATAAGGAIVAAKWVGTSAAVALVVLAGSWWILREPARPAAQLGAGVAPATDPLDVALVDEDIGPADGVQEHGARSPALDSEVPVGGLTGTEWTVDLLLRGWEAEKPAPLRLEVRRPEQEEAAFVVSADLVDHQQIDVGALFVDPDKRPDQFELRLDHPDHLPAVVGVLVPPDLLATGVASGTFEAVVTLERARAVVWGRVEIVEGHDAERVRVAIHALEEGRPARKPIEVVRPDAQGFYRLRLDGADEHVVVAYLRDPADRNDPTSHRSRLRPDCQVVSRHRIGTGEVAPLVLRPGEIIEGRVHSAGGVGVPNARLILERRDSWSFYGDSLTWSDGRFELHRQELRLAEDGRFLFRGLSRAEYSLSTQASVRDPQGIPVVQVDDDRSALRVTAPASDVRVPLGRLRALFVIRGDGRPVSKAQVRVAWNKEDGGGRTQGTRTDVQGQVYLELDVQSEVTFRVDDPRFPVKELLVKGAELVPDGVVEVQLEGVELEPATLLVHLDAAQQTLGSGGLVNFWLYEAEGMSAEALDAILAASPPMTFGGSGSASVHQRNTRVGFSFDDGTWTLSGLPREKYLVRAVPAAREGGAEPLLLPTTFEIDLRPKELSEHTWRAEAGGLLRLNLSAVPGLTHAKLVELDGRTVPANYSTGRLGVAGHSIGNAATGAAVYDVSPALPAGDYLLELSLENGAARSLPVRVEAGRINDFVVGPDDL